MVACDNVIDHFRVAFCLCIKTNRSAKPFLFKKKNLLCPQVIFFAKSSSFTFEGFRTWTCLKLVQGNSEMAFYALLMKCGVKQEPLSFPSLRKAFPKNVGKPRHTYCFNSFLS